MTLPVVFTANGPSGYNLTKSLRFRSSASAYLSRTISSNGSATTWTYSTWVKRGTLGTAQDCFLEARIDGNNNTESRFSSDDTIELLSYTAGVGIYSLKTTQVFRDPSAWYHIVIAVDTTQATASNRIKLYVNGVQVTAFSTATYPAQNALTYISQILATQNIGRWPSPTQYFDGYMAEVNFIDGSQQAVTAFGSTNALTGVWQPAKYTGTYGTNGFYLPFTNTTSTTTLGYDFSGNSNNWTTNNLSLTAGTTYDSMNDVPTLTSATVANYCVMNPLSQSSYITLSGGNLNTAGNTTSDTGVAGSTFGLITGKWYAEYTVNSTNSNRPGIGIIANPTGNFRNGDLDFSNAGSFEYYPNGALDVAGSRLGTFSTFTTGDIIGIAIDCDNGAAYVSKNNTWQNSGVPTSGASKTGAVVTWTPTSTYTQYVAVAQYNSSSASTNFGQRAFSYTPPTNFNSVNTYNLPDSTIVAGNKQMDATTYTGNGGTNTIVNSGGFQPSLVWAKSRSAATNNRLYDSVRGNFQLVSNTNAAEISTGTMAMASTGFVVGTDSDLNANGSTYVGWQWKTGGTAVTNTAGSISAQVSANTSSGFSVVTYTGTGANATVGHGLGVAPSMYIVKSRSNGGTYYDWAVYHTGLGGNTKTLWLNLTNSVGTYPSYWNSTSPTSSVFSLGNDITVNQSSATYVAYCWSEIAGFSKFGSYTGANNTGASTPNANGPFIYCGFRPKFVLIKRTSSAADWEIYDSVRGPYNANYPWLQPNTSSAEASSEAVDFLSNGFKIRSESGATMYPDGATFIYMAFAENPFKNALAR